MFHHSRLKDYSTEVHPYRKLERIVMSAVEDIVGTCTEMCPVSECVKREKNGLIHVLETNSEHKNGRRKADRNRMVKSYTRSAAGQMLTDPKLLRPVSVLSRTIHYLLTDVLKDNRVSSLARYNFINDRLRSVKQDGVIQRLPFEDWFRIIPSVVRFHALSAYWHCEERAENFDQKLNTDRLIDYLLLYVSHCDCTTLDVDECARVNAEMEALLLIVNCEDVETINRAILLDLKESVFVDTLKLILNWREMKYSSVIRLLMKLELIPACLFVALHLNSVRKRTLQVMCHAYNSKTLHYPLDTLRKNLLFNSLEEVIEECVFYEIPVFSESKTVQFKKILFRSEIMSPKKLKGLDEELNEKPISPLLLGG